MPDFIGIGAQKAGTSWLFENLKAHPEVWFPAMMKEVHFFDRVQRGSAPFAKALEKKLEKLKRKVRKSKSLSDSVKEERIARFDRLFGPGWESPDEWYQSLFSDAPKDAVTGEITPSYCAMGEAGIRHMKNMYPNVKLIFLIRDPVSRYNSQLRMLTNRVDLDAEEQRAFIEKPGFFKRGDYRTSIPKWDAIFGNQILYLPFGWVRTDPKRTIRAVEEHIGVSPWDDYPTLDKPVFQGKKLELDEHAVSALVRAAEPQYAFLRDRFGEEFLASTK